ncbi:MAG TPA: hypothetical protein VJ952_14030, partial [Opitutales bacterium]|nr:hypothetical protein [Opitutales bacterium]
MEKCGIFVLKFQKPFAGWVLAVHLRPMLDADLPFTLPREALMSVEGLPYALVAKGKVREVFDMGDAFLMV